MLRRQGKDVRQVLGSRSAVLRLNLLETTWYLQFLLKSRMRSSERAVVDNYAKKLHRKYIKPWYAESRRSDSGFYQMANGGISELAYAAWRKDKRLASTTFKRIFRDMNRLFYKDGYINNNSFRGVRGFWYHTYGVNSALATIGLARAWNVKVPAGCEQEGGKGRQVDQCRNRRFEEIQLPKILRLSRQRVYKPEARTTSYSPECNRH